MEEAVPEAPGRRGSRLSATPIRRAASPSPSRARARTQPGAGLPPLAAPPAAPSSSQDRSRRPPEEPARMMPRI